MFLLAGLAHCRFNPLSQIKMLEANGTCQTLCTTSISGEDATFINERIREDYALNWLVDGLPAAEMKRDLKTGDLFFDMGFNLGDDDTDVPYLNNHYEIVMRYSDLPIIAEIYHPHGLSDIMNLHLEFTALSES
jgi:hypothetical protein